MKKIFVVIICCLFFFPCFTSADEPTNTETEIKTEDLNESDLFEDEVISYDIVEDDDPKITNDINNNYKDLSNEINELNSNIIELQNVLNEVYSGNFIIFNDLVENTKLNVKICGETIEIGEGTKGLDNPFDITGIEDPTITVTDGTNENSYSVETTIPLYSLPDGTKDYIEIDNVAKTAKLYRNVGEMILTGNENWLFTNLLTNNYQFYLGTPSNIQYLSPIRCTHANACTFATRDSITSDKSVWAGTAQNKEVAFIYNKVTSPFTTVVDFKSFLAAQYAAGTPVTVQYKLEMPIITNLEYFEINAFFPTTIISTDKGFLEVSLVLPDIITDKDTIFVLKFCVYLFACLMVAFTALRIVFGFCNTGLELLSWLPFKNIKLFRFKERRRMKDD